MPNGSDARRKHATSPATLIAPGIAHILSHSIMCTPAVFVKGTAAENACVSWPSVALPASPALRRAELDVSDVHSALLIDQICPYCARRRPKVLTTTSSHLSARARGRLRRRPSSGPPWSLCLKCSDNARHKDCTLAYPGGTKTRPQRWPPV